MRALDQEFGKKTLPKNDIADFAFGVEDAQFNTPVTKTFSAASLAPPVSINSEKVRCAGRREGGPEKAVDSGQQSVEKLWRKPSVMVGLPPLRVNAERY